VQNTVGKLLEGKTPKDAAKLRILDPACGSGTFPLGAYQYLLNWHLEWYINHEPEKVASGKNPAIFQSKDGWTLTTSKKKEILLNNIYGVDIDAQAVEVTKLSLLLKVLEGESQETIGSQLSLLQERVLPDLSKNIQCGNSLIGPDYYESHQLTMSFADDEERYRVNAFDWKGAFSQVFIQGGFDAVIGNPPYIRVRIFKEFYPKEAEYLEKKYECATHVWDIYLLFYEKATELLKQDGRASFIIPIQTLHQPNCESIRRLLLSRTSIKVVADLSKLRVFQDAIVKNCILVTQKTIDINNEICIFYPSKPKDLLNEPVRKWLQSSVKENALLSMKIDLMSPMKLLFGKLESKSWRLEELCYVTFGLRSSAKGVGQGGKERLITFDKNEQDARPYLEGRDIKRYVVNSTGRFIKYIPSQMYSPRVPELFETKKIISQSLLSKKKLITTLDVDNYYVEQSLVCIIPHGILTEKIDSQQVPLEFILGILNSKLESFYFGASIIDSSLGGGLIHATPGTQSKLIIPKATNPEIKAISGLVEKILTLHKQPMPRTPQEQEMVKREIESTDKAIDKLVYELYGLTEEEIKIVEGK
jgi:hypothetical protein